MINRILFLLFLIVLPIGSAFGQLWQQTNGPGGDGISSIAVNKQGHIFVVSRGLQRSTDGGVSWVRLFDSIPLDSMKKIVVQSSGRLLLSVGKRDNYMGGYHSVFKSDDNGSTWQQLPLETGNIWQGNNRMLFAQNESFYVMSSNDGATWDTLPLLGITGKPNSFYSDKAGDLFVCAKFAYRSTDKGNTWGKIVNGLDQNPTNIFQATIGDLYAYSKTREKIYRSVDLGRTWTIWSGWHVDAIAMDSSDNLFVIDHSHGTKYYSASTNSWTDIVLSRTSGVPVDCASLPSGSFLYSAEDGIFRWSQPNDTVRLCVSSGSISSIICHSNGTVVSCTDHWVWNSTNQGNNWTNSGFKVDASSIALDSSKDILSGGASGILLSSDAGSSWKSISPDLTTGFISSIQVKPNNHIFAASSTEGVFRSTDNGKTWDQLNGGIAKQPLYSLALNTAGDVFAGGINVIYRSSNNALSWTELTTNFPLGTGKITAMVVNTRGDIIAGVENAGVFWSTDNGTTWSEKAKGLTATRINALVSTPVGKVFAATNNGVFFLDTAAGANWVPFNFGITATNILSLCRDANGRLYAGTEGSGVFRSLGTFNSILPGGPIAQLATNTVSFPGVEINTSSDTVLTSMIKNTGSDNLIILGADISSVIGDNDFSLKSPTTFPIILAPGASQSISLTFKPLGYGARAALLHIYTNTSAGENDIGLDGMGMMKIGVKGVSDKQSTSLGSAFPNPMFSTTTVPFSLTETEFVHLEVADALGRVVAVLADQIFEAGVHQIEVNANGLSNGMYYVRLQAGGKSEVKMIVKTAEP